MLIGRYVMRIAPVVALLLAIQGGDPALSQVERSGGGGANQQLYQDYQQALAERTQLQADNAKLKSDLADAQKQLTAAKQQLAASKTGAASGQAALTAAQAAQANTTKTLSTLRGQTDELVARFRETISQLRDVETDRTQLRAQLAQAQATFDQCALANYDLYQVDDEVLNRYAHQGAFAHMARAEPFTRIERTRIDNLVLEYRERAAALRVQRTGSAPAQSPGSGPGVARPSSASAAPPAPPAQH